MSWDDAYKQLEQELGRKPHADEVQQRLLEILENKNQDGEKATYEAAK